MNRNAGERPRKQRRQSPLAFQDNTAAFARRAGGKPDQACEHQLIADTLLRRHQQALVLEGASDPRQQPVIAQRRFAGNLRPRRVITPALFQIAGKKMQYRAIELRLRIVGRLAQSTIVKRKPKKARPR